MVSQYPGFSPMIRLKPEIILNTDHVLKCLAIEINRIEHRSHDRRLPEGYC